MNLHQVGMVISDSHGKILDVNDAFTLILGYTREECLAGAVNWENLTPPEQRHLSQEAIANMNRLGVHPPFEKEFFDKAGHRVSVLVQTTCLKGSQDIYLGLIIDHKAKKQCDPSLPLPPVWGQATHAVKHLTKQELTNQELAAQIRAGWDAMTPVPTPTPILNSATQARRPLISIGCCFFDKELRYTQIDPVLASINGFPIEHHLGRKFRELLPEYAAHYEPLLQHVLNTGEPILNLGISGEIPGEPGSYGYWLGNYHPVQSAGGQVTGVSVTIIEITRFKHAESKTLPQLKAV